MLPSIVWTGSEYLVVFQPSPGVGIRLQRLTRTLDPLEEVRVLNDGGLPLPDAAAGPEATLVVYNDYTRVRALLFNRVGVLLAEPEIVAANAYYSFPAVAARGSEFIVVAGNEVFRVARDGAVSALTTLPGTFRDLRNIPDRAVAVSAAGVQIAYERDGEIFLRTLSFAKRTAVRR